ncbi:substrate-binding domain-containing protein [Chthonobacter albigriseus]|uniref:substrate-binding domain-containing protein n=1 Tax=Chthonobacter albigriseus TaxID=1683161 RepID=UPI0015EEF7B9|nr:substrate-binding domain-containing protein [Chthonobacter albigriseus]
MRTLDLTATRPTGSPATDGAMRIETRSCGLSTAWTTRFVQALRASLLARGRVCEIAHHALNPTAAAWLSVSVGGPGRSSGFVEIRWGAPLDRAAGTSLLLIDGAEVARAATAHLHKLGHTAIAFLAGPPADPLLVDLADGHVRALAALGLPFDHELIVVGDGSFEAGFKSVGSLVGSGRTFTAVLAATAAAAQGALHALEQHRIPASVLSLEEDDRVSWCAVAADTVAASVASLLTADAAGARFATPHLLPSTLREL